MAAVKWFTNLRMRSKIISLVVLLVAAMALVGLLALAKLNVVSTDATDIARNWLPKTKYLGDLKSHAAELRRHLLQHVLSSAETEFREYEGKMQKDREQFEADLETLGRMLVTDKGKELYAAVEHEKNR